MPQNTSTYTLLYRVRLLLEDGQSEAALQALKAIHIQDGQQREAAYLLGWSYALSKQWDEAMRVLSPLLPPAYQQEVSEALSDRARHVLCLLWLGLAAYNLSYYEHATLHFNECLKIIRDRRVYLPTARIHARFLLAKTCMMRNLYPTAVKQCERALRLCRLYEDIQISALVYAVLCEAYYSCDRLAEAMVAGYEALRLSQTFDNQLDVANVHYWLGRVCFRQNDAQGALEHYEQSLALVSDGTAPFMHFLACVALVDVHLAAQRFEDAKRFCQRALQQADGLEGTYELGTVYQTLGKIALAAAAQTDEAQRQPLLEEAVGWFEQACQKFEPERDYVALAEVYDSQAQALEGLGRSEEAIACWRSAFALVQNKPEQDAMAFSVDL
ncbi:MAG TPA: tetratricopeptide repeat protein [Ktedonobacteraceae bacterium]|nr:tetratricopeptide repeat protein [Ktedonobacteraceae bacterium]